MIRKSYKPFMKATSLQHAKNVVDKMAKKGYKCAYNIDTFQVAFVNEYDDNICMIDGREVRFYGMPKTYYRA